MERDEPNRRPTAKKLLKMISNLEEKLQKALTKIRINQVALSKISFFLKKQ